eukprot:Colp12_sorted_trinity150504_noHs@632
MLSITRQVRANLSRLSVPLRSKSCANSIPKEWPPLEGLNFKCTACGKCCTTSGKAEVYVNVAQALKIAEELDLEPAEFASSYLIKNSTDQKTRFKLRKKEGACTFLDRNTNKCTIYNSRPTQCRTYPFWPDIVKNESTWNSEAAVCEGINENAERVDWHTIRRNMVIFSVDQTGEHFTHEVRFLSYHESSKGADFTVTEGNGGYAG